jgi:hypothetical protein
VLPWDAAEGNYPFKLAGAPVSEKDFGVTRTFRLWEYGPGDTVRRSTTANLRRLDPGVYELDADVDLTLSLKAGKVELSTDRQTWQPLAGVKAGEWLSVKLPAALTPDYLRVGG